MIHVGRMRIPQHAQLDRLVNFKGQRITLREAVARADPNETRQLRSGRVVTLQQTIDTLDAWEKRANTRLAHIHPHTPVPEPTRSKLMLSHQQLSDDLVQRRTLAASGWRAIIERPAGSPRNFLASSVRFPDRRPLLATPPVPAASEMSPIHVRARQSRPPHPATEPFDEVWSRHWGDPSALGAYLTSSAGNEFHYDDATGPVAGCAGVVEVGAWLLGDAREIVRVYAGAGATEQKVQGAARVYLVGDATPVWHRDGVFTLPKLERSFQTPSVNVPIGVIDPVEIDVSLAGTGTAMIEAAILPHVAPGHDFACEAVISPQLRATGTGGAQIEPMPGLRDALEALVGDLRAGLEANVTLLDLSLPSHLGLDVHVNPQTATLLSMDQNASVKFNADMLSGKLTAYLELDLNDFWGFVAGLFGADQSQRWEWDLHDWSGEHVQMDLAEAHNTIQFVQ